MDAERLHSARVVAAVIRQGDQLMVCQRPAGKRYALMWEFPGGKLQDGESPKDAAARELEEELELSVVSAGKLLYSHPDPGSEYVIEFIEVEVEGTPQLHEHVSVTWETPEQLLSYPLAPSDRAFVDFLLARMRA